MIRSFTQAYRRINLLPSFFGNFTRRAAANTARVLFILAVAHLFAGIFVFSAAAEPLRFINDSDCELLNVFVEPRDNEGDDFFIRLDLSPGAAEETDNPACAANLRVDTGLEFWSYPDVPLNELSALEFTSSQPPRLIMRKKDGAELAVTGTAKSLVPQAGEKPVCELARFRPKMPMKEVCAILESNLPTDDNNSLLTGLGFAGKVWAARLSPERGGPLTPDSLLDYLELRGPLSEKNVFDILKALYAGDYVPWEAEFPDANMDFEKGREGENKEALAAQIKKFLGKSEPASAEATIMLAPKAILPMLETADAPTRDAQLFTLILKPGSRSLIVDITAYAASE